MTTVDEYQAGVPHNVDNILTQEPVPTENLIAPVIQEKQDPDLHISRLDNEAPTDANPYAQPETEKAEAPATESDLDDYGNKIEKKEKLYTQAEVQEMMRDRNRRGEFARQEQQEQKPHQQEQSQTEQDWQAELEEFTIKTLEKREKQLAEKQWQQQETQKQQDFEMRFNNGSQKYNDFDKVVVGKPITPAMMMATRSMSDPASFLYAAAKLQPKELERIASIQDPYIIAAEIGRLDERMRRATKATQAPAPLGQTKSDSTQVSDTPRSAARIDDLINKDARRKYSR